MKKPTKAVAKKADAQDLSVITKAHFAHCAIAPSISAALVVEAFAKQTVGEQDISALINELSDANKGVQAGDMKRAEAMLMSQAHALQSIFVSMARRAALNADEYVNGSETFMRMALRAQNQCRMTLETLATVKNPPVIFAKQANISAGHQQVNNAEKAITARARTHAKK